MRGNSQPHQMMTQYTTERGNPVKKFDLYTENGKYLDENNKIKVIGVYMDVVGVYRRFAKSGGWPDARVWAIGRASTVYIKNKIKII